MPNSRAQENPHIMAFHSQASSRPRVSPARARRGERAQGIVEFALLLPLFIICVFAIIDFGRAYYYHQIMDDSAKIAARALTLPTEQNSDCTALRAGISSSNGLSITPDPHSIAGDSDPASNSPSTGPSIPPVNQGYIYLYPSASKSVPQTSNCSGGASRFNGYVSAVVTYHFHPWTPLLSHIFPNITLKSESVLQTEY